MKRPGAAILTGALSLAFLTADVPPVKADVKIVSEVTIATETPAPAERILSEEPISRNAKEQAANATPAAAQAPTTNAAPATPAANVAHVADVTYVTYYHGHKARRETADGSRVTLYDGDVHKVFVLNPAQKTYYELPLRTALDRGAELPATLAQRASLDRHLDLSPAAKDDGHTAMAAAVSHVADRVAAGLAPTRYTLDATVMLKPKAPSGGGFRGGGGFPGGGRRRGGGGGFPGGGFPGGGFPGLQDSGFPGGGGGRRGGGYPGGGGASLGGGWEIHGDVWFADAGKVLPSDDTGKRVDPGALLALMQQVAPDGAGALVKPLIDAAAKRRLAPVASRLILTRTTPLADGSSASAQSPADSDYPAAPPPAPETVITMTVRSVDTSVSEPDADFSVPAGYQQVDAPAPPSPMPSASPLQREPGSRRPNEAGNGPGAGGTDAPEYLG